jgi:hypothetical protein
MQIARLSVFLFLSVLCFQSAPALSAEVSASPATEASYESVHYKFLATKWILPFIQDSGVSGPFEVIGQDRFLFASRCGVLSYVERQGESIVLIAQDRLPFAGEIYCDGGEKKNLSGVKDLLLTSDKAATAGDLRLFLSYESQPTPGCIVLKVVRFDLSLGPRIAVHEKLDLFQSQCAPQPPTMTDAGGAFAETASHLYFSVGDFGHGRARPSNSDFASIFRVYRRAQIILSPSSSPSASAIPRA